MAVDKKDKASEDRGEPTLRFKGRQWIVGANVLVMVLLAAGLLVFANYLAFTFNKKSDWTSSGVNSLGEKSRKLMNGLEENVTLTSLYRTFQDPEAEAEAKKFRTSIEDILELYQTESPSKVDIAFVNPAKDRDKILALIENLRQKTAYQDEAKKHKEITEEFTKKLSASIHQLLAAEQEKMLALAKDQPDLEKAREYNTILRNCSILVQQDEQVKETVQSLLGDELPKYTNAVDAIKAFYEQTKKVVTLSSEWMADIDNWSKRYQIKPPQNPEDLEFFKKAPDRCKAVVEQITAALDKAKDLPTLKLEELDRQVRPDTVIVETKDEARVLGFDDVWPAKQQGQWGQAIGNKFEDRRFAGEVQITSAVLQLTRKEKTAVVFVRYGGQPLFFGGFMGGQARFGGAKDRLQNANFIVKEWDVATKKQPPEFEDDEKPARTIWVLLKPDTPQPPRGMPQPRRPQQFGPQERQAVMSAIGQELHVLLIAGWQAPPRMPMGPPPGYEYNDWLKSDWGLEVQFSYPVLEAQAQPGEPGKFGFMRNPFQITHHELTQHVISAPLQSLKSLFPEAAPIKESDKKPDGVSVEDLVVIPEREDMWAESDLMGLSRDWQKNKYVVKGKMDRTGPFPIAVAATKQRDGKTVGKLVLISSMSFANDQVAMSRGLVPSGNGFMLVQNHPGNMDLLVNAIHWLDDNEDLIGRGIDRDIRRLDQLKPGPGLTAARVLAVAGWPLLALLAGLGVWFVRRR